MLYRNYKIVFLIRLVAERSVSLRKQIVKFVGDIRSENTGMSNKK